MLPAGLRTLALCAALLFAIQTGHAQTTYMNFETGPGDDAEHGSSLYASGAYFGDGASAALGYRLSTHFGVDLAANRFLFGDDAFRPGVGVSYGRMLAGTNWGVEARAYLHADFSFGLFPGLQAGVFRRVALTKAATLFPQVSVFGYGSGFGVSPAAYRRSPFRDDVHAGLMIETPLAIALFDDTYLVATPMLQFGPTVWNRRQPRLGFTLGFDW